METRLVLASVLPLADPALFERALARVSPQRREKVAKLRVEEARLLSLGAALLLDQLLQEQGLAPAGDFALAEGGKPCLSDRPELHFSLSHSGSLVLCALSDSELGCDVETPRRYDFALVRRFFHPEEQRWFFSLPEREQAAAFLRLWTLKESYLKALGLGLALPLDRFCILPEGGGFSLTQQADDRPWRLQSYTGENFFAAVCALDPPRRLERAELLDGLR